jgi:hypothetical protein
MHIRAEISNDLVNQQNRWVARLLVIEARVYVIILSQRGFLMGTV